MSAKQQNQNETGLLVDKPKFSFFNTFINKQILLERNDLSEFLLTVHVVT